MKNSKTKYALILLMFTLGCSSSNDDPNPSNPTKSSAKSIVTFKFSGLSPEVVGTLTEADKKISITVPNGTPLNALVPSIVISDKATISPATGIAQNFTSPVKYTVTAEDATTQDYTVTVTQSTTATFTISAVLVTTVPQDGVLHISGTNFGDKANNKVSITNTSTNLTTEMAAVGSSSETNLFFIIPTNQPVGTYKVTVVIGSQSKVIPETITVIMASPNITSVDPTVLIRGNDIVITGKYFQESGNVVNLKKSGTNSNTVLHPAIVSETSTSIKCTISDLVDPADYTLSVVSNGKESFYSSNITVQISPDAPVITSFDDSSYKLGETITITGRNLKKTGFATNINFTPFTSGVTTIRSGVPNADGTQLTFVLPLDFTTGTYTLLIEIDGEFSEEYKHVIEITN